MVYQKVQLTQDGINLITAFTVLESSREKNETLRNQIDEG
jgi:hypothetical protein